jgi:hypothetical protein
VTSATVAHDALSVTPRFAGDSGSIAGYADRQGRKLVGFQAVLLCPPDVQEKVLHAVGAC